MDHGSAVMRILTMVDAYERAGWGVALDGWHAGILALAVGQRPDPAVVSGAGMPARPVGPWAVAARRRWRDLCTTAGVSAEDPGAATTVLELVGILRRRRGLLGQRWAAPAPFPAAAGCDLLDADARRCVAHAIRRYEVGMAVGTVLEDGHAAGEIGPLPDAGIDAAVLTELAAEPGIGWRVVGLGGGRVRIEQLPDAERDALIAEVDAAPEEQRW